MTEPEPTVPAPSEPGVWHKDGALAQIRWMAEWADRGRTGDGVAAETAGKIAKNLRAAADAIERHEAEPVPAPSDCPSCGGSEEGPRLLGAYVHPCPECNTPVPAPSDEAVEAAARTLWSHTTSDRGICAFRIRDFLNRSARLLGSRDMTSPVSGEQHERAVEAIDPSGSVYGLSPLALGQIIERYVGALAEQGVRLVDLREVVDYLRSGEFRGAHLANRFAAALERRFGEG